MPPHILVRPYGLPRYVTVAEYLADPVCYLSTVNYKVEAELGPTVSTCRPVLTVFDTGAGPNLIRADLLPPELLERADRRRDVVNLASASNHRLKTKGIVTLTVRLGDFTVRQPFVVTEQLGADAILGTTFIDAHVDTIYIRKRCIQLEDGSVVRIEKRRAAAPAHSRTSETPKVVRPPPKPMLLKVTQRVTLPARSETVVSVRCGLKGDILMGTHDKLYSARQVALSNGVATVRPNVPFAVRVANFSATPRILVKGQIVGHAEPMPGTVLAVQPDSPAKHDPSPGKNTTTDPAETGPPPVSDLDLGHLSEEVRVKVRRMLEKHSSMWLGHLGTISVTQHRIEVKPGSKPVHMQPYRAGPKSREIEAAEVDKMLAEDVIEPAQSEWASPVVLVPKSDGTRRFCVDYRKLNALTVKDTYPLPRMEECLDSLDDARIFTTLDCNSGYWQILVAPEDRPRTAFTCHAGSYQFRRMPFGLCNAPATF